MNVLIKLFGIFFKLYPFSFGGGVVMIPSMIREFELNKLATAKELTDVVAISSMSPGSIAINAALGMGYHVAGIPGAVASFLGILVPTAFLIIIAAKFFFKIYSDPKVKAAFYGLRPVITGIILYAATSLALKNGIIGYATASSISRGKYIFLMKNAFLEIKSTFILIASFLILTRTKVHPIFLIISSAVIGTIIF